MNNYVVIDLEMCNTYKSIMNSKTNYKQELIQIGAVSLDENYDVIDSFATYVSPKFGTVDGYIKQLTGISKEDTKNAPSSKDALESFVSWLPEDAKIVTWSRNDEKQIKNELQRKNFDIPELRETFGTWTDCQQMFGNKLNTNKKYKLSEALSIADICYDDGAHDALIDARNTARLFAKIQSEEELKLSPYFISASEDPCRSINPFVYRGKSERCYTY
jgi:inhibitor of KinA sporulation pathway (predicted exonuclease)